jgi:hypothetical protein
MAKFLPTKLVRAKPHREGLESAEDALAQECSQHPCCGKEERRPHACGHRPNQMVLQLLRPSPNEENGERQFQRHGQESAGVPRVSPSGPLSLLFLKCYFNMIFNSY